MAAANPVLHFGHAHAHLGQLTRELAALLREDVESIGSEARDELPALASELRDELLEHFANEEEGLFPFIRRYFPEKRDAVDRLQASHDIICGALVRFSFLAERSPEISNDARLAYQRFEAAYGNHSRDEAELLDEFAQVVTPAQQAELETLLSELG